MGSRPRAAGRVARPTRNVPDGRSLLPSCCRAGAVPFSQRRYGRTRRVMIGQFGPLTAENARREATRLLGQVRGANGDPAALRDAERQSATGNRQGARSTILEAARRNKMQTLDAKRISPFGRAVHRPLLWEPAGPFGAAGRRRRVAWLDCPYSGCRLSEIQKLEWRHVDGGACASICPLPPA